MCRSSEIFHRQQTRNSIVNRAEAILNRAIGMRSGAFLALKFAITGVCFWYVARQVNIPQVSLLASTLDLRWAGLATLMLALEIPVVGLRWRTIVDVLEDGRERPPVRDMISISAIGIFVGQILPNVAGDAVRVWLLARIGPGWRVEATSVLIDRGIGVLVRSAARSRSTRATSAACAKASAAAALPARSRCSAFSNVVAASTRR